jgi:hypothetical protein
MAKRSKTPIDEIAEDAIRRIREAAQKEKSMHAVEQQQTESAPRRGGGRPRTGLERKEKRGFAADPAIIRWVEASRIGDETFSQTVERILRESMKGEPKPN